MKRTNLIVIGSGLVFSALFYDQYPGINFLLFTVLMVTAVLILHPENIRQSSWWGYAVLALVSSLAVVIAGSALSVFATLVSWVLLAGRTVAPGNSVVAAGLLAALGIARSPYDIAAGVGSGLGAGRGEDGNKKPARYRMVIAVIVAIAAAIPSLILYRASNPIFNRSVSAIDLNWVEPGWIIFTLFSVCLVYGLMKARSYFFVTDLDRKLLADIRPGNMQKEQNDGPGVLGITFFLLINLMLLFMNVLDVMNIYVSRQLPEGITLSEFVHEAVMALVVSTLWAAGFILFLFKNGLNFSRRGHTVKLLVYLWIAQTAFVIVNTIVRNAWYINEYQLTILRLGVFAFLLLTLTGLVFTWIKVASAKSGWWLVTRFVVAGYAVLATSALINWERFVSSYNIDTARQGRTLDARYLLEMGNSNIPQMVDLYRSGMLTTEDAEYMKKKMDRLEKRFTEEDQRIFRWPGFGMRMWQNRKALAEFRQMSGDAR